MSFRENAEDDYWGWDHTGSESIVEGSDDHDERTFVDDEHERIFLDEEPFEFDKNRQVELRATDAVVSCGLGWRRIPRTEETPRRLSAQANPPNRKLSTTSSRPTRS